MSWAPESLLGTSLGPYQVLDELGRGGMAVVYKAYQPALERHLALKVLRPDVAANRELKSRFHREAETMASLNHPNVVKVLDRGEADELIYFAMEWVDGPTLKQLLEATRLSVDQLCAIAIHTASALAHAHAQGIVHRDVKPANVLWESDTKLAKVVDFGIARITDPEAFLITLTQANASLGTLDYMAPEQKVSAGEVDARADTYAFGVMLYEMFVGVRPAGRFKLPSELNPDLPQRLDAIVSRCLEPDPADRYPNMNEVVTELKRAQARFGDARWLERDPSSGTALRSSQVNTALPLTTASSAHPLTWLLACGVVLLGAGGFGVAAYAWGPWNDPPPPPVAAPNPLDPPPAGEDPPPDPVEPTDPPVEPTDPVDTPTDPPTDPVDTPTDPPLDPPTDSPLDPPVEPTDPVDPPPDPVDTPTDPPLDPPTDPPLDTPTDPPVDPPVDLGPLQEELRHAMRACAAIAKGLQLDPARLEPLRQRALRALEGSDAQALHASLTELQQTVPAQAAEVLEPRWAALVADTHPGLGLAERAEAAPRQCDTLAAALEATQAYRRALAELRHAMLQPALELARQLLPSLPPPAEAAARVTPDAEGADEAYDAALRALLTPSGRLPKGLVEKAQEKVVPPVNTVRTLRRPFLWPERPRNRNDAPTLQRIDAIAPASAGRCAVVVTQLPFAVDSHLTLAEVRRKSSRDYDIASLQVAVALERPARAIAPAGLDERGQTESWYLGTAAGVELVRLRVTRSTVNLGMLNPSSPHTKVLREPFPGDGPRDAVIALATAPSGELYAATRARVWILSRTHAARSYPLPTGALNPSLVACTPASPGWGASDAYLLDPQLQTGRLLQARGAAVEAKVAGLQGLVGAGRDGWCLLARGNALTRVVEGRARSVARDRTTTAELRQIEAVAVSGSLCYFVDNDGGQLTAYAIEYE